MDVRRQVDDRLPGLLHLFPGLTPMNVWQMTVADFHHLAAALDARMDASSRRG